MSIKVQNPKIYSLLSHETKKISESSMMKVEGGVFGAKNDSKYESIINQ